MSIHLTADELEQYAQGRPGTSSEAIARHLESCEFCSELVESLHQYASVDLQVDLDCIQNQVDGLCQASYEASLQGAIIALRPLVAAQRPVARLLAADGIEEARRLGMETLATLYSDNPEVVLRVVRDSDRQQEFIQLVAEQANLIGHVLIETSDPAKRFVTDANGRAELDFQGWEDLATAKWHIKMPELSFELEPLKYDSQTVKNQYPIVIDNQLGDVIEITYQVLAAGRRILIRVKKIEGEEDFESAHIIVSEETGTQQQNVKPNQSAEFRLTSDNRLSIRIYK